MPSHVGLPGNEVADRWASLAEGFSKRITLHPLISDYKTHINHMALLAWQELWDSSENSTEGHILIPTIPRDRTHIFGTSSARTLARLRLGYCGVNSYLVRHGLAHTEYCIYCLFARDVWKVETVGHRLSCPRWPEEVATLHTAIDNALQDCVWDFELALSLSLPLHTQIKVANAIEDFACDTTELGYI